VLDIRDTAALRDVVYRTVADPGCINGLPTWRVIAPAANTHH
jgi:hypothetical protein